jgi:BON domain
MLVVRRAGVHRNWEGSAMGQRPVIRLAVLTLVFAGGCARKPDDASLVTTIESQIASDQLLKGTDLRVNSSRGEVTLSGTVASEAARQEAFKLASQTPGVVKVNDEMTVQSAAEPPQLNVAATPVRPAGATRIPRERKKPESGVAEMKSTDNALQSQTSAPQQTIGTPATVVPPAPQEPAHAPSPIAAPAPTQISASTPTPQPAPQPRQVEVPVNSTLTVRMIDSVDSSVNRTGEIFHATLQAPVLVDNQIVVPRGADIYVRLASSKKAGRLRGKSELHLELLKMEFQGRSYSLYSSTYSVTGTSRGKNTAKKAGSGAAIGAVIGAIAGAGAGAAIGAGIGAGAGVVLNGATRGKQVKIPSETDLDFQLEQPVTVTVIPRPILAAQ